MGANVAKASKVILSTGFLASQLPGSPQDDSNSSLMQKLFFVFEKVVDLGTKVEKLAGIFHHTTLEDKI